MEVKGTEYLHYGGTIELVEAKKRAFSRWHEHRSDVQNCK